MMKIVEVADGEGLKGLMGKRVLLMCSNFFYNGMLTGVNDTCVLLTDASIVYDTGPWDQNKYNDAQKLPKPVYVQVSAIEAFMEGL